MYLRMRRCAAGVLSTSLQQGGSAMFISDTLSDRPIYQAVCMEFHRAVAFPLSASDSPLRDIQLMAHSEVDRERLLQLPSLRHSDGNLSPERGSTAVESVAEDYRQEVSRLAARDQELLLIREGKLRPHKKLKSSKESRREAMARYLQLIYLRRPYWAPFSFVVQHRAGLLHRNADAPSRLQGFAESSASHPDVKLILEENNPPQNELPAGSAQEDSCRPLGVAIGFFTGFTEHPQATRLVLGGIPNSAFVQRLCPDEEAESSRALVRREDSVEEAIFCNISNAEEENQSTEEEAEKEEVHSVTPALLQKMASTPRGEDMVPAFADEGPESSPPPIPPAQDEDRVSPRKIPTLTRLPRPRRFQSKPVLPTSSDSSPPELPKSPPQPPSMPTQPSKSPPEPPSMPTQPSKSPPQPPRSPPQPPHTPPHPFIPSKAASSLVMGKEDTLLKDLCVPEMPSFILQFRDNAWFSRIFPDMTDLLRFEVHLRRGLLHSDLQLRIELLHALQILYQQGHLRDLKAASRTLMEVINSGPAINIEVERCFLYECLQFMAELSGGSQELVMELLVRCAEAQPSDRGCFLEILQKLGVEDPHGFLARQFSSWDRWESETMDREALRRTCGLWLDGWSARLMRLVSRGQRHAQEAELHVSPCDVLNYFCAVQLRRELQKNYQEGGGNTVLPRPPITRNRPLLRLGEAVTHLRDKEQRGVSLPAISHRSLSSIAPFLNLPLKRISLQPFTPNLTRPGQPLSGSLTQDVQRYFILQRSHLDTFI